MSKEKDEKKVKNKKSKKIGIMIAISILLVVGIVAGIVAEKMFHKKGKADGAVSTEYSEEYASTKRDTRLSVNSSGDLEIKRNRVEDKSAELSDAWTVLVYMTGTDLESEKKASSTIMDSMTKVGINSDNIKNLNLLVQTGGTNRWHNSSYGSKDNIYRLKLNDKAKFEEVEKLPLASMGDPDTLADFIKWGVSTYPAKNTMIIFWDHGGPDNDMCYDELYKQDCLTMNEIEYAFAVSKEAMQAPFDVAVTHTCSNGTVELANVFAPYVDYLVTTPTYTPTFGFDYTSLVNQLLKESPEEKTPLKICNNVLDGFKRFVSKYNAETVGDYALMIYDLTKLDEFLVEFNKICKQVYEMSTVDRKSAKKLNKAIRVTSQYLMETNFDIACYLDSLSKKVKFDTTKCLEKLNNVVLRYIRCANISPTCAGMAMYHPVGGMSIQEFNIYRNKAVSPYYLKYLERSAHLMAKRNFDNYKDYSWETSKFFHEETFDFLNYTEQRYYNRIGNDSMYKILTSNPAYKSDGFVDSWNYNLNEVPLDERREFSDVEIAVTEDTFTAKITEDVDEVNKVYNTVTATIGDMEVCLGENADATYDETTGEVKTNFNGEWLMLGDGQLLTTYYKGIVKDYDAGESSTEYVQYAIPVVVDDKEATIYVLESDDKFEIRYLAYESKDGINSGYTEEVKAGLTITPIYDVWNEEEGTYETEYGEEYTFTGTNDLLYTILGDNEYSYSLIIEDVMGAKLYSKEQEFSVAEKELTLTQE